MPLSVLQVAYPLAAVSSASVGGAEQVIYSLDRLLSQRGHRSYVLACEGSEVSGTLLASGPLAQSFDDEARRQAVERHRAVLADAIRSQVFDVVHLHGLDFL